MKIIETVAAARTIKRSDIADQLGSLCSAGSSSTLTRATAM
ncbi:hypothetical protein [Variovorax sp. J31P179]|nr:hypothetical protein [Variovorax sp. J31P179]